MCINNKYIKLLLSILLVLYSASVFSVKSTQNLRIGVNKNNPPFEYLDLKGNSKGFEIDLIKAIMRELDINYNLIVVDNSIEELKNNKIDIVLNFNYGKNPDFCYSYPYNKMDFYFYVKKDSPYYSIKDLSDKKIITSNRAFLRNIFAKANLKATIIKASDVLSTISTFKKGDYDAFFMASNSFDFYSDVFRNFSFRKIENSSIDAETFFTARKESKVLMSEINDALFTLKFNGEYNKIKKEWAIDRNKYSMLDRNISFFVIFFILLLIFLAVSLLRREEILRKRQLKIYNETFKSLPFLMGLFELNYHTPSSPTDLSLLKWYSNIGLKYDNFIITNKNGFKIKNDSFKKAIEKILSENKDGHSYYNVTFEDDSTFDCYATYKFVKNKKKKILVITINDIGNLLHMERMALESEKNTSAFLASLSHEIRTPLNAILGFSDMIDQSDDFETRKTYSEIILKNNKILETLINKVLMLSKVEVNKVPIHKELINLTEYFKEIFYNNNLLEKANNITFSYFTNIKEYNIFYDKNIIKTIADTILENAIKFTEKGDIEIGFFIYKNDVFWYCKDSGVGISEIDIKNICNKFEKGSSFKDGFGLGLSISLAYCNLMHSKMGVYSKKEDKGSIFWVKSKIIATYEYNDSNDKEKIENIIKKIENSYIFNEDENSTYNHYLNTVIKEDNEKN